MLIATNASSSAPDAVTYSGDDLGRDRSPNVRVVVRRRQVLMVLLGSGALCAVGAGSGSPALWWPAALFVALAAGYLALVARLRHLQARRQINRAFGCDSRDVDRFDWRGLERELHMAADDDDQTWPATVAHPVEVGNRDLGRFLLAWSVGWILTPVVTLIRLVRGDLSIPQGHGLADRIVRLQRYGRAQSLRWLTMGAAASVSISAVGGLTATAHADVLTGRSQIRAAAAVSTTTHTAGSPAAGAYTLTPGTPGDAVHTIAIRPTTAGSGETIPGSGPAKAMTARYRVLRGNTLWGIARSRGTSVAALTAANHIPDPNLIFPGQELDVPPGAATRPAPAGEHVIVRAGETVTSLARRYHTTLASIVDGNGLSDPDRIYPGQVLSVREGSTIWPAEPATSSASTRTTPALTEPAARAASAPAPAPASVPRPATSPAAAATPPGAPVSTIPAAKAPAPVAPTPTTVAPPPPTTVAPPSPALSALPLPAQYLRGGSVDQGVDYDAPGGTPLYAMGPGKIIAEGISGFGPNAPVLQITAGPLAGRTVYYGHAGADLVPVGATVAAGQQISIVGYGIVGISTGPHLEIGFYPPGNTGAGQAMLNYIDGEVGHSTGG